MIVSAHAASGGLAGALTGSRAAALALGPPLHLAADAVPHEDIESRRFEIGSGLAVLALLALGRGPLDPATLGAGAACLPDLEHVFARLRPGGEMLFHGRRGWHRPAWHPARRVPAEIQLVVAGTIIGALASGAPRARARRRSRGRPWSRFAGAVPIDPR